MKGIREANGGLEIGAGTTITEITRHAGIRERYPLLAEAAGLVASPQIRNQGTLGGNVSQDTRCHYYAGWPATGPAATSATRTRRPQSIASTRSSKPIGAWP